MRVVLRDEHRALVGRVNVDAEARPTRVTVPGHDREVFLHWEGAVDDAGQLRTCISCGSPDLFREKAFPQITALFIVLAFAGGVLGISESIFGERGVAMTTPMLIGMSIILVAEVCILLFSKTRLVCYKCGTSCNGMPIARYHRSWDRSVADRYPRKRHAWTDSPAALTATIRQQAARMRSRNDQQANEARSDEHPPDHEDSSTAGENDEEAGAVIMTRRGRQIAEPTTPGQRRGIHA